MEETEESSSSSWRFSMELLSHVHTLQVFLFNSSSQVKPHQDCVSIEAVLLCAPPSLACSWKTPSQALLCALRLPLPLLLYDYSASPRILALPECIQLSLPLLPLSPSHLHAFSSMSLAHGGIRTNDPDGIWVPDPSVQHEANTGIYGENGSFHCGDEGKNLACNDSNGIGHDDILKTSVYTAADYGHHNDDAHESHEDEDIQRLDVLASSADDNVHQNEEFDGAHDLGHAASLSQNRHCCHKDDCGKEENHTGHSIHLVSGHGQCRQRSFHMDSVDAIGTQDITQGAATASNFHGYHNCDMSKVYADSPAHEDAERISVNKGASKNHEYDDTSEFPNVENVALDIPACNYHHGTSFLQCQNGRNAVDFQNNGSSLPKQHRDPTVLNSSMHQGCEDQKSQGEANFYCKKCSVKVSKNPVRNLVQLPCFDWREIAENWFGACCCSFGTEAEVLSASFEKSLKSRPGKCLVGSSTFYVNFSDVTVESKPVKLVTDNKVRPLSTLHFLALGNGFMVWENQHSKYFSWLPVYCACCASLLGAYACKPASSGVIRDGLHLFRCQITALNADGTLDDMLRYSAFKELLAKELRLRTEENTSYRFLIRSLRSQLPLLQLVVLDYDSLICTGNVTTHTLDLIKHPQTTNETSVLIGEAGLQQSMKVLFLDCTGLSADEIRSTEHWVQDYDAETIFMLEDFVNVLKGELLSNMIFYPAACGLSQVFHGSFVHITQT